MIWWARFLVIAVPGASLAFLFAVAVGKLLRRVARMYEVAE